MPTTVAELRTETGAGSTVSEPYLTKILAQAADRVNRYISVLEPDVIVTIPETVFDEAVLACACEIFNIRRAPNGVLNQQYDVGDGSTTSVPVRISGDPMRPVRPLLSEWIGGLTT